MAKTMIALLVALLAAPLLAQGTPPAASPEKESFVVQPKNVAAGARDQALRFVANTASGFTTSSSKPPQVKFSAGATLKPGTFVMLNANEAECKVDIADDAVGTIDVTIELYSVNGTKTFQTLRSTMGIAGATAVPSSPAKVGAEGIELVRVNVADAQSAGAILISGKVNGSVSISAPTGTAFTKAPAVTATGATIGAPQLASANTIFSFNIGNVALAEASVRVAEITLNTQLFGLAGGVEGQLACEVTGTALSGQSALVVIAHTAKTTIQGENDTAGTEDSGADKPAPAPTQTDGTGTTTAPSSINTGSADGRPLDSTNSGRERDNNNNQPGANPGRPNPSTAQPGSQSPSQNFNRGPQQGQQGQQGQPGGIGSAPPPAAGGAFQPAGKGGATPGPMADDGQAKPGSAETPAKPETPAQGGGLQGEPGAAPLQVSAGLYFCNKEFEPVGALVLDKAVGDEAGHRIWILMKRPADKDPAKVETVTVKLTVSGVTRELILTETGKDTGEFRCGKEGILLVAPENPDSNSEEAPPEPPKARVR